MAVTPVNPPVPQNNNVLRAVYDYLNPDNISTDQKLQAVLNFLSANGANLVFQDIYSYLGGANWNATKLARMQTALHYMHLSGIKVFAYAGNTDWGGNQQWVQKNIIYPLLKFQDLAPTITKRFDGFHLDVEYWTDPQLQASVVCPQLCDLGRNIRKTLDLPIGCFAAFFLKDNSGQRPAFPYQGKTAQDGEFLMDNFDQVVVGAYRNHAQDNVPDGPGQISLFQPWYDYAVQVGRNIGLLCGSECQDIQPPYTTYFGMTKAQMESEHALISAAFTPSPSPQSVFLGQAIDSYSAWAAMS
jgi:hypothetical protein